MNADSSSSSPTPSSPRLPHSSHALQNCDSSLYSEPSFGHSIDKNVPSRLSKLRRLQAAELPVAAQRLDDSGACESNQELRTDSEEDWQPMKMERSREYSGKQHKRVTRRGPMDEMRQLVRILVKVIPQSSKNIRSCDEGGGGNRISEDQIKHYLAATLGDAPQPKWGVPEGWSRYLAELFSWVTGYNIRPDQAAQCAKREPGRSWEAIDSELANLGILPSTWPLPLSREGMGNALIPAAQLHGSSSPSAQRSASAKRSYEDHSDLFESNEKRARSEGLINGNDSLTEVEAWQQALNSVNIALSKAGSTDSLDQQMTIARLKADIQTKVQVPNIVPHPPMLLAPQSPQLVPISVPGQNGQLQTAYTLQLPTPGQLSLAPTSSLDLGSFPGLITQQPMRLGGGSAFQAVRPLSHDSASGPKSQLPCKPSSLRVGPKGSCLATDTEHESPSGDEGNSAGTSCNSGHFTWSGSASGPINNLFKPTALKTDSRTSSQSLAQKEVSRAASGVGNLNARPGDTCTAFESLQKAAKLLSMSPFSTGACGQIHNHMQADAKPILIGQQCGKSF